MPRGVPKNGFRSPRGSRLDAKAKDLYAVAKPKAVESTETDAEISARLTERFDILADLADAAIDGEARALIVSGPAGLGKSFTIEKTLEKWDPNGINHKIIKGYVRATGLYKLLWQHREAGQVLVFDDADTIFFDDTSLNLLKAVCDTTDKRIVSYLSEGKLVDEDTATVIDNRFEFNGTIIFITNYDFDAMIEKGHKLAPHLQALVSRAHYIDLAMKTTRDYMVRIRQVIDAGLLKGRGLTADQEKDVVDFIVKNQAKLRELSLRIALKVAVIRKSDKKNWEATARVTCCKN
jgi:hypothetical protein